MLQSVQTQSDKRKNSKPVELPSVRPNVERVAVLLNRNARRVSDRLARRMEAVVGRDNLYYSRTLEEAEAFSREIVQQGYGTVVCGGGDGTLMRAVNLVRQYVDESNAWRLERYSRFGEVQSLLGTPRFGFLRLGTGNGIGGVVGAGDPLTDLRRIVEYGPGRNHRIPTIDLGDEHCLLAGMGYDSTILNDYNWLKNHSRNRLLKPLMQTVAGYFAAVFMRTLPRIVVGKARSLEARVTNLGRAYYIDPRRGDAAREVAPGTTLFEGNATIIGAGTMPFFGYGFRIYPFANIVPGMMHLRIAKVGPVRAFANLPSIWRGTYRHSDAVFDFVAEHVRIELERPFPFQHSGDAQGLRDQLDLKIAQDQLELVDFYRPRPLT